MGKWGTGESLNWKKALDLDLGKGWSDRTKGGE